MKRINCFGLLKASAKIAPSELLLATRFLAVMLKAGDSPEQALKTIAETRGMEKQKEVFLAIRAHILNGETLSSVLNEYRHVYPRSFRKTVVAIEEKERFDLTMNSMADNMEDEFSNNR